MELTSRQMEFVEKLLDLYAEVEDSIHYSRVADRLGVSRSTAYEMLRLLEQKGFARAHYYLDESGGPGRSTVLFSPTERAHMMFRTLQEQVGGTPWEDTRKAVMEVVARNVGPDRAELAEILEALGRDERALSECTRVITAALLLCSEQAQRTPGVWDMVEAALQSESGLVLLPGIALATIEGGECWEPTLARWQYYQQDLISLAPEQQDDLLRLSRDLGQRLRVSSTDASNG